MHRYLAGFRSATSDYSDRRMTVANMYIYILTDRDHVIIFRASLSLNWIWLVIYGYVQGSSQTFSSLIEALTVPSSKVVVP
jgi:hypothetical protein